jgi:thiol-disulfide isomerase/thioredoxin
MSPFFQLPNHESKQELIFFPTSISLDSDKYVNISYNVGDNRSYFLKLHLDIINVSLYNKENIEFLVNLNINLNYYIELVRNIRKLLGFSTKKKEYYKFGNVNEIFASSGKINKKKKTKKNPKKSNKPIKKKKKQTNRKETKKKKLIYFHMKGCGWCKKFEPMWSKLKKNMKDVKFMKINGPKNESMKDKYSIQTYPALVKIEGDSHELFNNERTLKNIKDFLK